jgi:DNA repair exonuclease SbcCD nuclease subunit
VALGEGVWIHGVSFASRHAPESLLPKFPAPVPGAINIAMLHTSLTGAEGHDPYAPCTLGDLTAAGFDYWALGHVHRRQVHATAPWVVMPGTPQGRDMGESGPKSATLLTVGETIEIEEVPTSAVEFRRIPVDVADAESPEALRDLLKRTLRHTARDLVSDSAVIRLGLSGRTALRWQILRDRDVWTDTVAQYATETGRLYLDKVVFDLSDPAGPGHTATDELAAIMDAIRDEPAFAEACRAEIDGILQELPPQQRAALLPDETAMDALARRLATSGASQVLARLRGSTP